MVENEKVKNVLILKIHIHNDYQWIEVLFIKSLGNLMLVLIEIK